MQCWPDYQEQFRLELKCVPIHTRDSQETPLLLVMKTAHVYISKLCNIQSQVQYWGVLRECQANLTTELCYLFVPTVQTLALAGQQWKHRLCAHVQLRTQQKCQFFLLVCSGLFLSSLIKPKYLYYMIFLTVFFTIMCLGALKQIREQINVSSVVAQDVMITMHDIWADLSRPVFLKHTPVKDINKLTSDYNVTPG